MKYENNFHTQFLLNIKNMKGLYIFVIEYFRHFKIA